MSRHVQMTTIRDTAKPVRETSKRPEASASTRTKINHAKVKPPSAGRPKVGAKSKRVPHNASTELSAPVAAAMTIPRITKKSQLIALLSTPAGVDIAALSAALGWKSHTTRAALTGLRKAGFRIEALKLVEKGAVSTYRIITIVETPDNTIGAQ